MVGFTGVVGGGLPMENEGQGEGGREGGGVAKEPAKEPASQCTSFVDKLPFSKLPFSFSPKGTIFKAIGPEGKELGP